MKVTERVVLSREAGAPLCHGEVGNDTERNVNTGPPASRALESLKVSGGRGSAGADMHFVLRSELGRGRLHSRGQECADSRAGMMNLAFVGSEETGSVAERALWAPREVELGW